MSIAADLLLRHYDALISAIIDRKQQKDGFRNCTP